MTYEIYEGNMPRLQKKLATIQKQCAAYGCEFSYKELGEVFREIRDEETGKTHAVRFIAVDVEGTARMNNWEFVATIEHSKPYNIIRSFRPEVKIPQVYYTADPWCEHCGTARNRKDTYLIRNTVTGKWAQVGKSCLKAYTRGLSAEAVARYISMFDELIQGDQVPSDSVTHYYSVSEILQTAVEAVRLYGYTKRYSEGMSTVEIVQQMMFELSGSEARKWDDGFNVNHEGNAEQVNKILEWLNTHPEDFGYITNVKAACQKDYCEYRDFGLICSAVAAYNRETEKTVRHELGYSTKETSVWVGVVGDRIELHDLTVQLLTSWATDYGLTSVYKLTAKDGNVFTWKTGQVLDRDCTVSLKGTIKAHNEFRGTLQTELTRCRILSNETPKDQGTFTLELPKEWD